MRALFPRLLPAALLGFVLAAPAAGDVVTTKDGLVLEGAVTKAADGSVTVATADGKVVLPSASVGSITPGVGPREAALKESAAVPATDADGHYRLAVRFEAQGLADLARREYEIVLVASPDHAAARRSMGYERIGGRWLSTTEAQRAKGLVLFDGKWILPAEAAERAKAQKPASVRDGGGITVVQTMRVAAIGEPALARAAAANLVSLPAARRLEPAVVLLIDGNPKVRAWAAEHLGALGDGRALKALLTSAVRDRDESVRTAAVVACAALAPNDAAIPFVRGLGSERPGIVMNSARALATLGDPRGITYIVRKYEGHGESPRAYYSQIEQQSYISDYDVEVAQTSSIADPIVGVLQEGEVLDVKIHDASIQTTTVEQVLLDSFNRLAKANARNAADVAAWWKQHGASVPRFASAATAGKPAGG